MSLPGSKFGRDGATAAVPSSVTLSTAETAEMLPAVSHAVAVRLCVPSASAASGVRLHRPATSAVVVLSRNVRDLQVELPRLAQAASISLRRVEPLDDSLESVFGYLVEN